MAKLKNGQPAIDLFSNQPADPAVAIFQRKVDSLKRFSDYLRSAYGYETGSYDGLPNAEAELQVPRAPRLEHQHHP